MNKIKELITQKKKEQQDNFGLVPSNDLEETEQMATGVELTKIINELTAILSTNDTTLKLDIKDIDGNQLKTDSIIQMLDEDEEPFDDETSSIRVVLDEDKYSVRAFEKNHTYTAISNDTYANLFRIVEVA